MATPDYMRMTSVEAIRNLRGRFPQPTNGQALAALEAIHQWIDASSAIIGGLQGDVAVSFLSPDGVLPRMRLLAAGWVKPGDKFRGPTDAAWWRKPYGYPLWNPLETYAGYLDRALPGAIFAWDEELANGDIGQLSHYVAVMADDLEPVMEAPCPQWIIPPGKGQLPVANPECAARKLRDKGKDVIDKVIPRPKADSNMLWLLLVMAAIYISKKRK